MFTLLNLLKAYYSCRHNKRKTINALKFEVDFETNLLHLFQQLQDHSYKPSRSICFVVTYPKLREVFAADFQDRVIHHLLVAHLEPMYEKCFINASFACRKNKGLLTAVQCTKKMMLCATRNKTKPAYFGQFDVRSFFTALDKDILYEILSKMIRKKMPAKLQDDLLWLTKIIIYNDPTKNFHLRGDGSLLRQIPTHKTLFKAPKGKGLPIGNLTSQFFANVYLNELDQYVKRELQIKYYIRYVDDMVVISDDMEKIRYWRKKINDFLINNLKLKLHPDKDKYGSVYSGIDFLGYVIKPTYNLVRKRIISNLKIKLWYFNKGLLLVSNNQQQLCLPLSKPPKIAEIIKMLAMVNSYYGHLSHARSFKLRKNIYEKHFENLKTFLQPTDDYKYFIFIKNSIK